MRSSLRCLSIREVPKSHVLAYIIDHASWTTLFGYQSFQYFDKHELMVLLEFLLTVKAATLICISGCGSAISSAKEGYSGFIYNLVKSK